MSFFTSKLGIGLSVAGALILAALIAWFVFIKPQMDAQDALIAKQITKIDEQGQTIGTLQLANGQLAQTVKDKNAEIKKYADTVKAMNDIIDTERQRADIAESELRAQEGDRDTAEANGKGEDVLASDRAQQKCLDEHLGSTKGKCVNGVFVK